MTTELNTATIERHLARSAVLRSQAFTGAFGALGRGLRRTTRSIAVALF